MIGTIAFPLNVPYLGGAAGSGANIPPLGSIRFPTTAVESPTTVPDVDPAQGPFNKAWDWLKGIFGPDAGTPADSSSEAKGETADQGGDTPGMSMDSTAAVLLIGGVIAAALYFGR